MLAFFQYFWSSKTEINQKLKIMLFRSSILILDIIVCSSLLVNTSKALNFENNGYKNLVVSISPDVEEGTDGESIIENIKVVILN